jgi:hypothetical protein
VARPRCVVAEAEIALVSRDLGFSATALDGSRATSILKIELDTIQMPPGTGVSGLESDGRNHFFCGGGKSGTVRVIQRPK